MVVFRSLEKPLTPSKSPLYQRLPGGAWALAVVFSTSTAVTNSAGKFLMVNSSPEDAQGAPQMARKNDARALGEIQVADSIPRGVKRYKIDFESAATRLRSATAQR